MQQNGANFEWPLVHETTTHVLVASKVFDQYLHEKNARNEACWKQKRNWFLGFYRCREDSRLWVPMRGQKSRFSAGKLIINFGHPMGKKAAKVLGLAYGISAIALVLIGFMLAGKI